MNNVMQYWGPQREHVLVYYVRPRMLFFFGYRSPHCLLLLFMVGQNSFIFLLFFG